MIGKDKLIETLINVQKNSKGHYISEDKLEEISKELGVSLSKVHGVASFYSMLSTKERGEYVVQICNSGPCYIQGANNIATIFEEELGIKMGEVTEDKKFSLEFTSCIGACDIAPAVKINNEVYGGLNKEKIRELVEMLRKEGN
ncbi:complex I 24 kDa subunit family protein [Sporosalibacterium faouarense]|uniref:NADH-quinone oxidoreductase subunit NuoE family protein n=1 Tax=Sporosalibacterium faouarense TaxID=516123 RepID=UPI00141C244F|nr:NAD(P)H-dependent oxidoreductase subunit E [Sporosalibacterium faouarense]MTI46200.1 NAD(P)H-dependent oxidoreductase subunit E [Bacillota bacterium]